MPPTAAPPTTAVPRAAVPRKALRDSGARSPSVPPLTCCSDPQDRWDLGEILRQGGELGLHLRLVRRRERGERLEDALGDLVRLQRLVDRAETVVDRGRQRLVLACNDGTEVSVRLLGPELIGVEIGEIGVRIPILLTVDLALG